MIYKTEDIFGWQDRQSRFLCSECFDKEYKSGEVIDTWEPVEEKDQEEYTFICDGCHCKL